MTSAQARQFSSWLESERNQGFSVIYSTRAGIEEVSRGVDGDDHGVSDDFLRSQLVYRCIHSMLGQNSPSSPLSPDNPPQFCLPNWASYQRNPFASVLLRPEQGFEADVTPESTTFAFPTCVDLTKPYSPYGSLLTR